MPEGVAPATDLPGETLGGLVAAAIENEFVKVVWNFDVKGVAVVGGPTAAEIEAARESGGSL